MTYAKLKAQLKAIENVPWVVPPAAAEIIAERARELAAVDTGEMKSKIKVVNFAKFSQVEANAKHSGYIEFGTYKMAAQPFLRPAVQEQQAAIRNAVAEAMMDEIKVAVKGGWVPAEYRTIPGRPKKRR